MSRLSREIDTKSLVKTASVPDKYSVYQGMYRRNFLYSRGKIGLTRCVLLVSFFNPFDELSKFEQISHPKGGPTGGKDDARINGSQAGPGCWQNPHLIRSLVEGDAVFPPTAAVAQNLKLLAVQGMEGMGDRKKPFR